MSKSKIYFGNVASTPTPTPTPTPTLTPSVTPTNTATLTPSSTVTPTITLTPSVTPTHTPTLTPSSTNIPIPGRRCLTWSEADLVWITTGYTWNEVCIVSKVETGGKVSKKYLDSYKKLPAKEKEVFISLILKIKGEKITQKKLRKKYKVVARDVEVVIETVLGVKITPK